MVVRSGSMPSPNVLSRCAAWDLTVTRPAQVALSMPRAVALGKAAGWGAMERMLWSQVGS